MFFDSTDFPDIIEFKYCKKLHGLNAAKEGMAWNGAGLASVGLWLGEWSAYIIDYLIYLMTLGRSYCHLIISYKNTIFANKTITTMKRFLLIFSFLLLGVIAFCQQKPTNMKLYGVSFSETRYNFREKIGDKLDHFAGIDGCHYWINPYGKGAKNPDVIHNIEISTPSNGYDSINHARIVVELMIAKYGKPTHHYHQQTNVSNSKKAYDMYEWVLPNGFITVKTVDIGDYDEGHVVINYYDTANIKKAFEDHINNI